MPATRLFVALSLLLAPAVLYGQDDEAFLIYATYYKCDPTAEGQFDTVLANAAADMDALEADGTIGGWGWIAHHTGGPWRRATYFAANGMGGILDAQERIGEATNGAFGVLGAICKSHDDYIWRFVTGSRPAGEAIVERPAAGYSMYAMCRQGDEDRLDEIVTNSMAPIFDRHVGDGALNSWGWWAHEVGGKYRRLLVLDGASHSSVMAHRAAIEADLGSEAGAATDEFFTICSSHQDYLWDIMPGE